MLRSFISLLYKQTHMEVLPILIFQGVLLIEKSKLVCSQARIPFYNPDVVRDTQHNSKFFHEYSKLYMQGAVKYHKSQLSSF